MAQQLQLKPDRDRIPSERKRAVRAQREHEVYVLVVDHTRLLECALGVAADIEEPPRCTPDDRVPGFARWADFVDGEDEPEYACDHRIASDERIAWIDDGARRVLGTTAQTDSSLRVYA